jgi:hypothetical protein
VPDPVLWPGSDGPGVTGEGLVVEVALFMPPQLAVTWFPPCGLGGRDSGDDEDAKW